MKLLSIDFDFFFPTQGSGPEWQLYDWGHAEFPFFKDNAIWVTRAAGFLRHGLPLPGPSKDLEDFWDRFKFHKDAKLFIADSHRHIVNRRVIQDVETVINFDAHHDLGYDEHDTLNMLNAGRVDCATWGAALLMLEKRVEVVYPRWRIDPETGRVDAVPEAPPVFDAPRRFDDGLSVKHTFRRAFVCKSSAWTPSWLDDHFQVFIDTCPIKKKIWLEPTDNRNFNVKDAEREAAMINEMMSRIDPKEEVIARADQDQPNVYDPADR